MSESTTQIPDDWRVTDFGRSRAFPFEDPFGPLDLASALSAVAARTGAAPRYRIEGSTLTVEVGTPGRPLTEAETGFIAGVEERLARLERARADRNLRPARALIRLWLEAQDRFEAAAARLAPEHLDMPVRPGAKEIVFSEAIRHPAAAGYSYLAWIRRALNLPDTGPAHTPAEVMAMTSPEEVMETLAALRRDLEATVAPIPEGRMEDRAYLTNWGSVSTVDTMLEHAIMHWHRHRLQIEGFLGNLPSVPPV
jgi:hypothetical protein